MSGASRPDRVVKSVRLANGAERLEHFDFLGRLHRVEEPDGSWLRYRYGQRGHLQQMTHASGETVRFFQSERMLRAVTHNTETVVRLDDRGFPVETLFRAGGHEWRTRYRRDRQGRILAIQYPQSDPWLSMGKRLACGDPVYGEARLPRLQLANGTTVVEEWTADASPRLTRIAHEDASGAAVIHRGYAYDDAGRLRQAGELDFSYDETGRLVRCGAREYGFDGQGRMVRAGDHTLDYGGAPHVMETDTARYEYDALGRRTALRLDDGTTRYHYNLFGQLARVDRPDGDSVDYIYDGFGRLVGRRANGNTVYYILDFDGRRISESDETGRIFRSYLWFGPQCIGRVDGPCGGPLALSFHRIHGGTLAGIGDASGQITPFDHQDPYGADLPIMDGVPGYAGLFGDPDTGLLLAGSRWLDPALGQFITPDSWYGTHALDHLPRGMRTVFDALPGGTGRLLDPQAAYDWCSRDPVNYTDPTGHNFMGLVWSFISFFLWSMQVTSIAFQMEIVNLILFILFTFPVLMPAWDLEFWQKISPWNAIPPLLGSTRQMVPFCFPFNSLWNASGAVFTMGSVIWVRGEEMGILEDTAQRDLIVCSNAASYLAVTQEAAADTFRVRSPNAQGTANASANGTRLTGQAVTAPAGSAVADVFVRNDWLSIRLVGGATDELRQIANVTGGGDFDLNTALPNDMWGQAVEITRLDNAVLRLQNDERTIARTVRFVRGQTFHIRNQLPAEIPSQGLNVAEFLPSGQRQAATAGGPREPFLVRMGVAADQALYAANDFVRVRAGATHSARQVGRLRASRDLILDTPLPNPAPPTGYPQVEIVKMDSAGAAVAGQTGTGNRVNAGQMADLRGLDGLGIENVGGAPAVVARRIVTQVFLSCPVAALPNALHGTAIAVDLMSPDAATRAGGTVSANNQITTPAGQAGRFSAGQPVRVRKAPSTDHFTILAGVDDGANRLTLDEPMPAGDFPNTTAVSVHLMTAVKRFEAEPSAAPATQVTVKVDRPGNPAQNNVIRIRDAAAVQGGALRQVSGTPTVIAELDTALPATHTNNLSVQRFTPVANTLRQNASAPLVQLRFDFPLGHNFGVGNELHLQGGEEAWGRVHLLTPAGGIELEDPVEFALNLVGIAVQRLTATGQSTADGSLQESLILVPSQLDEEPITRRRAVEFHEMRHVWQYAVLGPFFFSFPLPWLIHLGFSFTDMATSEYKWARHFSVGAVDSLFAVLVWGVGALFGADPKGADENGEITDTERKVITLPADTDPAAVEVYTEGSPCEVAKGDYTTFNIIDGLDTAQKRVTLRFALESDKFAVNDRVRLSVSPFDKIRSTVNKWFSLNLERLWSDHIPVAWGRALSRFLNRDSWFPLLGLYPIGFAMSGFDQEKMHFEQDASYHSGDVYSQFSISEPSEIYVGQFCRAYGFFMGRGAGDRAAGISDADILEFLTVEPPTIAGMSPTDLVFGSVPSNTAGRVRFRENFYIQMHERVENVVGAYFAAARPGDYRLHVPGELVGDATTTISFDADFIRLRNIQVKPLEVAPEVDAAHPVYETERVQFHITGDGTAQYKLQYRGALPANVGIINGPGRQHFTAPLTAAATVQPLEITATYDANSPVFSGPGQSGPVRLTADQLTHVCQELDVTVAPLPTPAAIATAIGTVQAGHRKTFDLPIAPASVSVTSAIPPGAAVNASVVNGTGRPASLTFIAPDALTAAANVNFDLVFGSGAITKTITVSVQVTPSP